MLRGESPAVDSRPVLSTSDSTWLDGPRTDAACPGLLLPAMEFMPGVGAVIRPVGPAHGLGGGDGRRIPRTLGAPQGPQGSPHDAMRPPHDRPLPWQILTGVCASCSLGSRQDTRWRPSPRNNARAHQPLPTGRTAFRVHVAPLGTGRLPIEGDRHDYGRLA